jgi:hypothetical protein
MDGSLVSLDFELIGFAEELGHLESLTDVSDTGAQQAAHAVALDRLLCALRTSEVAMATLHKAAADEIAHAVLSHRRIVEPSQPPVVDARLRPLAATLARLGQRRR